MDSIRKEANLKQSELKEENVIPVRVRMSVRELAKDEVKKTAFLSALRKIQQMGPDADGNWPWNSFWTIAGIHGEPFQGEEKAEVLYKAAEKVTGNELNFGYWGGYCQHGNVLFPFWHRAYVLLLENALRSVMDDGDDVTVPYWDYSSKESLQDGVPEILTQATFKDKDGETYPNPLRFYEFQEDLGFPQADKYYHKPKGYKTHRYPFSGIQSPEEQKNNAHEHNLKVLKKFMNDESKSVTKAFNNNLKFWMLRPHNYGRHNKDSVYVQLYNCLNQHTYTVFSNTTSATSGDRNGVALEQPHNDIHLATGGFTVLDPQDQKWGSWSGHMFLIPGANGDMGENETAAFDPIFFLHHCNIDRMLWIWQKKYRRTKHLNIIPDFPGTKATSGNITYGQKLNENLTMETQLKPFDENAYDLIDINNMTTSQGTVRYEYTPGSFDMLYPDTEPDLITSSVDLSSDKNINDPDAAVSRVKDIINSISEEKTNRRVTVHVTGRHSSIYDVKVGAEGGSAKVWREDFVKVIGLDKDAVVGSFMIRAWYSPAGKDRELIGQRGILDRWDASNCQNCQIHRMANVSFSLGDFVINRETDVAFDIVCRDMEKGGTKVLRISTSTDDNSDMQIDNVRFYSEFTNRPQDSDGIYNGIRVDYRRPVAWEEARPAGSSDCCPAL